MKSLWVPNGSTFVSRWAVGGKSRTVGPCQLASKQAWMCYRTFNELVVIAPKSPCLHDASVIWLRAMEIQLVCAV